MIYDVMMILLRSNLTSNLLVDETDSDNLWHRMAWSKAIGIRSACRAHFRHSNPWWTLLSGTTNHPTQAKSAISIHFFLFPSLSQRNKMRPAGQLLFGNYETETQTEMFTLHLISPRLSTKPCHHMKVS